MPQRHQSQQNSGKENMWSVPVTQRKRWLETRPYRITDIIMDLGIDEKSWGEDEQFDYMGSDKVVCR